MSESKNGNKWHALSVSEVLRLLRVDPLKGLSSSEVEVRLKHYGFNTLPSKKKSPLVLFIRQFANFLIAVLLVATAISAVLGDLLDAVVIFAMVLLMGVFGFIQEYRSEKTLEALKKLASPRCRVLRNSVEVEIETSQLVPGDIVLLREGDRVPADIRLIKSENLEVDESPLTGESTPVVKDSDCVLPENTPVAERRNMVFTGTNIVRGRGIGVVVATGVNSELGRIAKTIAEAREERTPLEVELDVLGRRVGFIVLAVCIVIFLLTWLEGFAGLLDSLMISVALAVAAVPEGLPAIATAVLAIGAYRMAKKNALVKKLSAVEALGSVDVICADKTGTITKGEMTIKVIKTIGVECIVEGAGYEPRGGVKCNSSSDLTLFYKALAAHTVVDAKLVREGSSWIVKGSPTEGAALVLAYKALGDSGIEEAIRELELIKTYPFDRFRKRKSTIHRYGSGYLVVVSGAPEILLERSSYAWSPSGVVELSSSLREELRKTIEDLAASGYRTFGVAYRVLNEYCSDIDVDSIERDLVFYAVMGIIDPPREGVLEAVKIARRAGIKTIMVTGDHKLTALAVAKMIGLDVSDGLVLEGRELDSISDEELLKIIDKVVVYARVTPEHKARIVKLLKKKGYRVAMTGDGVNDAPALKEAHVGVAMGVRGTDVAKEASQLVLLDDNYVTIVEAVREGRVIFENLKKPVNYLLTCNMGEVGVIFGSQLLYTPPPLEPTHLLWINIVTDSLPAVALGVEPPEPGIMDRPPRRLGERMITKRKILYYVVMGGVLAITALWLYISSLEHLTLARTLAFTALVVSELGRALSARSENIHFWRLPVNKWLLIALVVSIGLQLLVLYTPLAKLFHTTPLQANKWLLLLLVPLIVLLVDEVRKALKIRV